MNRLSHQSDIHNGFDRWQLPLYFSKPVLNHLSHFVDGMFSTGFTGKLTEVHALSHHKRHRTTLSHFLQKSSWNEQYLLHQTQSHALRQVKKSLPLFLLIDDTTSEKCKPSSRAERPTEACGFHYSHTTGRKVWGHQGVQLMVKTGETAYPYEFQLYDKEGGESKIQLATGMISRMPVFQQPTYVLCDSWYTSRKMIETALSRGFHLIGALKTNRILYPQGIRMGAKKFASYISPADTDSVTVGKETYRVYRYEGALNDIEDAVVLLCWHNDDPMDPKHMRCFVSTDRELTSHEILSYYSQRWSIETYFKQVKGTLGMDGYQVRSMRSIRRFWILVQFVYVFVMDLQKRSFSAAVAELRSGKMSSIIEFVYQHAAKGVPLDYIKKEFRVA